MRYSGLHGFGSGLNRLDVVWTFGNWTRVRTFAFDKTKMHQAVEDAKDSYLVYLKLLDSPRGCYTQLPMFEY